MTLKEARALRDTIRATGIWSVTPTGHGPDGYFARIWGVNGQQDFRSPGEWAAYVRERDERRRREQAALRRPPRSPIEILIDRACGLA